MSDPQPTSRERKPARLYVLICRPDGAAWRFTLVDGRTDKRRSFRDLAVLAAFLETKLARETAGL